MQGKLLDITFGINNKQRITVEVEGDFRPTFNQLKDDVVSIEIKKYRKSRSLDANAYAWVLIDKIAAALSVEQSIVYKNAIREIGGVSQIVCVKSNAVDQLIGGWESKGIGWQTDTLPSKLEGCTNVVLYFGSSSYDTKQMKLLIDNLVEEAKGLGIETMTPDEIRGIYEKS
ncbi:MAG: hypothetical protein ACOX8A_08315 [Thermacetogeniaceae bacterium]|jgi:hypothetical protein